LAAAGGRAAEQLANQERSKLQWRQRMKEFIAQQLKNAATANDR
jgi:hypothetical protein